MNLPTIRLWAANKDSTGLASADEASHLKVVQSKIHEFKDDDEDK